MSNLIGFNHGTIQLGNYTLIPNWRLPSLPFAKHLKSLFIKYDIDTVLDVGANRGQYRDFLRNEVNFNGRIHSFEPQSNLVTTLKEKQTHDSSWTIYPYALGSENTVKSLNVMASDTFSSLRNVSKIGQSLYKESTSVSDIENIRVRRLDDLKNEMPELTNSNLYLKVDTQGYDAEVFKGADTVLKSTKALQFELAIQQIYDGVDNYKETLSHMESIGFSISGLFPISLDKSLRAIEFDCVMVRTDSTI